MTIVAGSQSHSLETSVSQQSATPVRPSASAAPRSLLQRTLQPQFFLPAAALLILGVLWISTLKLARMEGEQAEHTAQTSVSELLGTYQAQMVKTVQEIDQTLKLVKYSYERQGAGAVAELDHRDLLPPSLLFTVSLADRSGTVIETTGTGEPESMADQSFFERWRNSAHLDGSELSVSTPRQSGTTACRLQFTRPLTDSQGQFTGAVSVSVDAGFFVSDYDVARLGQDGVLGLLGADGAFRVRRSGDRVSCDGSFAAALSQSTTGDIQLLLSSSPWDHVWRYIAARRLYEIPFTIVVGLSRQEQLSRVDHDRSTYLQRAALASGIIVLLTALLTYLAAQLETSRRRAQQARIAHAEQVEYLAYHDGLTGLPNRSLFSKLLAEGIRQARRDQRQLAVMFMDLDRFKQINDTLGHEAGDQLLCEVAKRLRSCVRESDTVARLGGDEFVVILTRIERDEDAAVVAQKVLAALGRPFLLAGQDFRVTVSIGICRFPGDGEDEQTLTKHSDIAMYKAKEQGRNNFQFYCASLSAHSLERLSLEASLRHAIERQEFRLHYQAKRDVTSRRLTGMEALLRWEHPDLGTIQPRKFLAIAEETGLIVPIGKWVLRSACAQNVQWQLAGLPKLSTAVNLSQRQFLDDHLLHDLEAILRETGMEPQLLELGITESVLLQDTGKTVDIMTALKKLGVKIAIDDFGTGYSSLLTLQRFPIDSIKLDSSLLRGVTQAGDTLEMETADLASAIIQMGRSLSLTIVAQGVETRDQAENLHDIACDEVQGFYYNEPLPPEEFEAVLKVEHRATREERADYRQSGTS
jgi:diguanylate cyclase (GGDEF)-like protein